MDLSLLLNDRQKCPGDEMMEIVSTTSSIENDYAIEDTKEPIRAAELSTMEKQAPEDLNNDRSVDDDEQQENIRSINNQKLRAALIEQKSLTIPIPSKRKAPNPPSTECFDDPNADGQATENISQSVGGGGGGSSVDKKQLLQSKTFGKVFLKRFLKIGKQNESEGGGLEPVCLADDDGLKAKPKPKPRLTIVHPFELNGLDVKVVKNIKESREEVPSPPPRKPQRHLRQHKKSIESTTESIGSIESTNENNRSDLVTVPVATNATLPIDAAAAAGDGNHEEPVQTGSESESELYAQYSFCSSENETSGFVDDDDDAEESAIRNNLNLPPIDSNKNVLQISIQAALVDKKSLRLPSTVAAADTSSNMNNKRKAPIAPPPPIPQQSLAKQVDECDGKPIPKPKSKLEPKSKPKLTIVHPFKLSGINVQVVINIEKNREVPSPPPRKPQRVSRQQKTSVQKSPKTNDDTGGVSESESKAALSPDQFSQPRTGNESNDCEKLEEPVQAGSESESELYAQYSFCSSENETSGSINDDDADGDDDDDDDDDEDESETRKVETKYDSRITLDPINHQSNIYIMDNQCFVTYPDDKEKTTTSNISNENK